MSLGYVLSEPVKTWRLSKTVARHLDFRPIEAEDMRYVWAAYQRGALPLKEGMSAEQFRSEFETFALSRYDAVWTLFAETRNGFVPVGLVTGFWLHQDIGVMVGNEFIWFPWASKRNRLESAVNFFNKIRKEIPMIYFVAMKNKKFFEAIARHGIVRRIGTSHIVRHEPVAVWETRG